MSARIATRGEQIIPKLVKSIDGTLVEPEFAGEKINYDKKYWDYVHQAMVDVVHSKKGTARSISKGLSYKLAGKTGTAQGNSCNAYKILVTGFKYRYRVCIKHIICVQDIIA